MTPDLNNERNRAQLLAALNSIALAVANGGKHSADVSLVPPMDEQDISFLAKWVAGGLTKKQSAISGFSRQ